MKSVIVPLSIQFPKAIIYLAEISPAELYCYFMNRPVISVLFRVRENRYWGGCGRGGTASRNCWQEWIEKAWIAEELPARQAGHNSDAYNSSRGVEMLRPADNAKARQS